MHLRIRWQLTAYTNFSLFLARSPGFGRVARYAEEEFWAMPSSRLVHVIDSERRDLLWRLALAARLSLRGFSSTLVKGLGFERAMNSTSHAIVLGRLPSNVGCTGDDDRVLQLLNRANAQLIFFHDEGAFFADKQYSDAVARTHILGCAHHNRVTRVMFWGNYQRSIAISRAPSLASKFRVLGFPKLALYQSDFSETLAANADCRAGQSIKHARDVLIVTRGTSIFPAANHPHPLGPRMYDILSSTMPREGLEEFMLEKWTGAALESVSMLNAIGFLATTFPTTRFRLRPHPGEHPTAYRHVASRLENVTLDTNLDVAQSLSTAQVVIGNRCTTGVEAYAAGVPYINFIPRNDQDHGYNSTILASLGTVARSRAELGDALADFLLNGNENREMRQPPGGLSQLIREDSQEAFSRLEAEVLETAGQIESNATGRVGRKALGLARTVPSSRLFRFPSISKTIPDAGRLNVSPALIRGIWSSLVAAGLAHPRAKLRQTKTALHLEVNPRSNELCERVGFEA